MLKSGLTLAQIIQMAVIPPEFFGNGLILPKIVDGIEMHYGRKSIQSTTAKDRRRALKVKNRKRGK